jgi:nucleotide-binding universal stress UspA family protein
MYSRIVVGYDDSDQANDALSLGQLLASLNSATLVLVSVVSHGPVSVGSGADRAPERPLRERAQSALEQARSKLAPHITVECEVVEDNSAARGLQHLAEEQAAELVVLGSGRHGSTGHVTAGSVGSRLLHGSMCPVAVAPRGFAQREALGITRVGVAFDGSPEASQALDHAVGLCHAANASLRAVSVVGEPLGFGFVHTFGYGEYVDLLKNALQQRLDEALEQIDGSLVTGGAVFEGDPAEVLASQSGESFDLLVMGSRAYGPVGRVLLGSVSSKLMRTCPTALVVVPRAMHAQTQTSTGASAVGS